MQERTETVARTAFLDKLIRVRVATIVRAYAARKLGRHRRQLIDQFLVERFLQADRARELRVTRQAIPKVVAVGKERPAR